MNATNGYNCSFIMYVIPNVSAGLGCTIPSKTYNTETVTMFATVYTAFIVIGVLRAVGADPADLLIFLTTPMLPCSSLLRRLY
jgi:hypothetical protein